MRWSIKSIAFLTTFLSSTSLADSYLKPLFVVYQMITAMKTLHLRGISLGDVSLNDVFVDQNYLVQLRPRVLENLRVISVSDFEKACGQLAFLASCFAQA